MSRRCDIEACYRYSEPHCSCTCTCCACACTCVHVRCARAVHARARAVRARARARAVRARAMRARAVRAVRASRADTMEQFPRAPEHELIPPQSLAIFEAQRMPLEVSVASLMTRPPAHTVFGARSARARSEKSTPALYDGCTVPLAACSSRAVVQRPEAVSHVRHASRHRGEPPEKLEDQAQRPRKSMPPAQNPRSCTKPRSDSFPMARDRRGVDPSDRVELAVFGNSHDPTTNPPVDRPLQGPRPP